MIKNIFRLFFLLIAAAITVAILYVFDLPPFIKKVPVTPSTDSSEDTTKLPANLQDPKVPRDKNYDEMVTRAAELEKAGYPALAIAQYQEAYKKDATNLKPLYEIGKIQLRTGNFSKAEDVFTDLTKRDPTNTDAKIYLGRSLLNQRKITDARKIFDQITDNNQTVKYYQGITAAYFGESDRAKSLFNEAVKIATSDDITKKANNFLGAYNEFKFNIESPDVHLKVLLARSFNQCGEYEMAIPLLFEVTKSKLDYRDAWILLGYAYLQTGKYQDAVEALERAKTLDNQKPETLFYLGLSYYSLNKFQDAEANLSLAKQYGFQPQILVNQKLAEIYLELQNYSKSAASYEDVLSLNAEDVNYYIKPMWIYIEKTNQPQKALALAQKAFQEHPKDAMSSNLVGWAMIYNNNFSQAETFLKTAQGMNPALDAPYLNLGILYEKINQPQKALSYYQKAHDIGKNTGVASSASTRYNQLLAKLNDINTAKTMQANLLAK